MERKRETAEIRGGVLPAVARSQVEERLLGRAGLMVAADGYLAQRRGLFVTIWHSEHGLRGCKGTIFPARPDLVEETRHNALSAAFDDWRCPPVAADELNALRFEVSVLGELEPVTDPAELDPGVFGVVVAAADGRRGLLLPGVRGIETAADQIATARRKAGIEGDETVELMRFRIEKFQESQA